MIKNILAAAAIGAAAMGAHAAPVNLVENGGFDGSVASYVYNAEPASVKKNYAGSVPITTGTVANWTGSFVSIAAGSTPWGSPGSLANAAGHTSGYVAGIQADGSLSQALDLDAGSYALVWSDANRSGSNQTYQVSFNGVTLEATPFTTISGTGWKTELLKFTLDDETTGVLTFKGLTNFKNTDATSFIDNVSIVAVPEPTSMLMMSLATLGLLAWRRRAQV